MNKPDVVIIDYGVGNLFNVQRAFKRLGFTSIISYDQKEIECADRLLLPGVGAFDTGMKYLKNRGLVEVIRNFAAQDKPLLGICLGMQLLMSHSEENGLHEGLDLMPGEVKRFKNCGSLLETFKIPQIGWNFLMPPQNGAEGFLLDECWGNTLLDSLGEAPFMYFVHSYYVIPKQQNMCLALTDYGNDRFCSVVRYRNVAGCQFHPERSGDYGLKILKNFVTGKI